jgi:hypothetical protein
MICGSPAMLDAQGLKISPHIGEMGDYVIERAWVPRCWPSCARNSFCKLIVL